MVYWGCNFTYRGSNPNYDGTWYDVRYWCHMITLAACYAEASTIPRRSFDSFPSYLLPWQGGGLFDVVAIWWSGEKHGHLGFWFFQALVRQNVRKTSPKMVVPPQKNARNIQACRLKELPKICPGPNDFFCEVTRTCWSWWYSDIAPAWAEWDWNVTRSWMAVICCKCGRGVLVFFRCAKTIA